MRWRPLLSIGLVGCLALGAFLSIVSPRHRVPQESVADLVQAVLPGVVSISVKGRGETAPAQPGNMVSYAPHIVEFVGAGIIVDPSGVIVTNKHVVDNAYEIRVTLHDGTTVDARLLWKGLGFDLALLKIEVNRRLPVVRCGNSDAVHVGDRVIAVGDPLGLAETVTSGIVSALHRDLRDGPYNEYIQTDAPINHGNSGGPLFNMRGEVIGLNNQIYSDSPSSGSIGLGFAIPSNDIQFLIDQVREHGNPSIGWVGLRVQRMTPDLAEAFEVPVLGGAIVAEVTPGSPADLAGIRTGDVILAEGKHAISDYHAFNRSIARSIGQKTVLNVWRGGTRKTVSLEVKEWPQALGVSGASESVPPLLFRQISDFGLEVSDLTQQLRDRYDIESERSGPVVTNVVADSAASGAKLKIGEVILKVQLVDVHSVADLSIQLTDLRNRGHRSAGVFVSGPGGTRWVTLLLRL